MILGGLWHGANWTFLLWGCLHGLYFLIYFLLITGSKRIKLKLPDISTIVAPISILTTFFAVVFAWVLFRAESLSDAFQMHKTMLGLSSEKVVGIFEPTVIIWILLLLVIVWFLPNIYQIYRLNENADNAENQYLKNSKESYNFFQSYWWGIMHGMMFFSVVLFIAKSSKFLYFQF
jgi:alginate O-acetyltransferase complex protein AlgI